MVNKLRNMQAVLVNFELQNMGLLIFIFDLLL